MRALAASLILSAAPALAQQAPENPPEPTLDTAMIDACLVAQAGEDGDQHACAGQAADACMNAPGVYSTAGMSWCFDAELAHWDGLLNTAYVALMDRAKATDTEMKELGSAAPAEAPRLRDMQRTWIAFRDAACTYEASRWGGGTGAGPASLQCALDLTARQYLLLDAYLGAGD